MPKYKRPELKILSSQKHRAIFHRETIKNHYGLVKNFAETISPIRKWTK